MIPAQPGVFAHFEKLADPLPVIAWDDDGNALIPTDEGSLTVARRVADFRYVEWPSHSSATQLAPGGGYIARWPDGSTVPVIAWAACRDGKVRALVASAENYAEAWTAECGYVNPFTVSHPDHTEGDQ